MAYLSKGEYSQCVLFSQINGTTIKQEVERFNKPIAPKLEFNILDGNETTEQAFIKLRSKWWNDNHDMIRKGVETIKKESDILDYSMLMEMER